MTQRSKKEGVGGGSLHALLKHIKTPLLLLLGFV